jgi:hypothetical protein
VAQAAEPPILDAPRAVPLAEPSDTLVELRFGPYRPQVDEEFGGRAAPYREFFGKGSSLLASLEIDRRLWSPFGSLFLAGRVGWFHQSAANCVRTSDSFDCGAARSKVDDSALTLVPLSALLVYRFDLLARRWRSLLVPYVKAGLTWDLWWFDRGDGSPQSGGTWGYTTAFGVAIELDRLDHTAAVMLSDTLGIDHTYVFVDYERTVADGLWSSHALHVGDASWSAGFALSF